MMREKVNFLIYPYEKIIKAIEDYSNIASINIEYSSDNIAYLTFNCNIEDFDLIRCEFFNYMIELINSK